MKEDHQSLMSVTMVTVHMLLSVSFLPDVWAVADYCGSQKPAFKITTPNMMEALNGSCLLIPCSITSTAVVFSKQSSGFWIKGDSNIYSSSNSVKSFPVTITGNLTQRDCTTVFSDLNTSHSGAYFFRIDSSSSQGTGTACADPLQITVKDSPWRPKITTSGGLEDLKEKESVSITCSAPTPCPLSPPELTWNLQPDSGRQTQKNPDGTSTTKIQENMTLSDTHDGYNITCSVSYPVDGGKRLNTTETVTLHVSYAPKDTSASISPSGLVSAGSWVKLSCSSRAKPPVSSFSWFRISSEGPVQVSEEQLYSFNVSEGGEFYCVAANNLGNQTSSWIPLNITGKRTENSHTWIPYAAWIAGLVLIFLIMFVCCLWIKHQTQRQTRSEIYEEADAQAELHYGDVTFVKRRPEASQSSVSEQDRGQQEETVYSQVKVS
ncbi:B-cell receptor CD22-like [Nothobranchius furzeri]|uniref:B-cell receptor CD22-like n=1 Tax=Nothobranchius furzeri TaxID=105023 RepID=A0A9D3BP40_NOTFU|nr:B-cell receptor CD22-like [Nothobranchius furzeri]